MDIAKVKQDLTNARHAARLASYYGQMAKAAIEKAHESMAQWTPTEGQTLIKVKDRLRVLEKDLVAAKFQNDYQSMAFLRSRIRELERLLPQE